MRSYCFNLLLMLLMSASLPAFAQCGACQEAVNLVTNGNFSSGNTGFTTSLNYATGFFCPLCPENTYTVGTNAFFYHTGFSGTDHTNPPNGNFFIANGAAQQGAEVWCQNFTVQPNVDYTLTFWARDVTNNSDPHPLALLQVTINGVPVGDTLSAAGGWQSMSEIWNSGSTTTVQMCIVNLQTQGGGNDFGLDDISLTACENIILSQSANAGPDLSICSGDAALIGQNQLSGYNYSWDNPTGLSSSTSANPVFSLQNQTTAVDYQTFILTTDSANVGCITHDTLLIALQPMPSFSLGPDQSICPGETVTLDAGSNWDSVVWDNGILTSAFDAGPGNYSATVQYGLCDSTDQIVVMLVPMPVIDLGQDTTICEGATLELNAGVTGTWSDNSISDTLLVNAQGEYSFLYQNGNCSAADTVNVLVTPLPQITLTPDTSFCQGSSITLQSNVSGLWNTGATGTSIQVNQEGYYDVVVVNGNCQTSEGSMVIMNPLPAAPAFADISICEDDSVTLSAYSEINTGYVWSSGDSTAIVTLSEPGYYDVTVSNACGSVESEFYLDTYPCTWGIYIPSAFTPNDDTFNEGWAVQGYNVTEVRVHIYNRLGDLIFFASELGKPWQPGTGIGDDVYNYLVTAKTFNGEYFEERGRLYLLR